MKQKLSFYFLIILIFSSCGGGKLNQSLKEGKTIEDDYITTIPFIYDNGLIVIEVIINNHDYNFILDTGATNIISTDLAKDLKLNTLGAENVYDVHGNNQMISFAKIDNITIGTTHFLNTTTGITDVLSQVFPFSCMKVDGIIGSNLMQHAIWDFDFKNQKITITDREDKLNIPSTFKEAKIYIGVGGIPSLTTYVNDRKIFNFPIDLGFDGGIVIPISEFKEQKENGKIDKFIKGFGELPTGAFGKTNQNVFYTSKIDKISFGDFVVNDNLVYSDKSTIHRIGLGFFKDYRIILNWDKKRIKILDVRSDFKKDYETFGYTISHEDSKIIISSIIEQTSAAKYLKIGDQLLSINEKNLSSINNVQWCEIWSKGIGDKVDQRMNISILRNGEKHNYKLEKTHFF